MLTTVHVPNATHSRAGQAIPRLSYKRVAGMLAAARPIVPAPIISAMPRAGDPTIAAVDKGIALTIANSNTAIAMMHNGKAIQSWSCHTASPTQATTMSPAPAAVLRSLPHASVRRADVSEAANSVNPSPIATTLSAVGEKPNASSSQLPNVTNNA